MFSSQIHPFHLSFKGKDFLGMQNKNEAMLKVNGRMTDRKCWATTTKKGFIFYSGFSLKLTGR